MKDKSEAVKIKQLNTKVENCREFLDQFQNAFDDLNSKYLKALDALQTLSCGAYSGSSPEGWRKEDRMAWTAATALEKLSQQTQRKVPQRWEYT